MPDYSDIIDRMTAAFGTGEQVTLDGEVAEQAVDQESPEAEMPDRPDEQMEAAEPFEPQPELDQPHEPAPVETIQPDIPGTGEMPERPDATPLAAEAFEKPAPAPSPTAAPVPDRTDWEPPPQSAMPKPEGAPRLDRTEMPDRSALDAPTREPMEVRDRPRDGWREQEDRSGPTVNVQFPDNLPQDLADIVADKIEAMKVQLRGEFMDALDERLLAIERRSFI